MLWAYIEKDHLILSNLFISGVRDPYLEDIGKAGRTSSRKFRNVSRNFHKWIERERKTLPVHVSSVLLRVKEQRPKVKLVHKNFPMIGLSSWAKYLLTNSPGTVLGGHSLQSPAYKEMLRMFWHRYFELDRSHPVFEHFEQGQWENLVPYCVHGDEGRGKAKTPVLVTSYQMVIPPTGLEATNIAGYLSSTWSQLSSQDTVLYYFKLLFRSLYMSSDPGTRLLRGSWQLSCHQSWWLQKTEPWMIWTASSQMIFGVVSSMGFRPPSFIR